MKVTIGTAPDSWGVWFPDDPRQMPWQRFLDEVTEAGYKWFELGPYGYLTTNLSGFRGELESAASRSALIVISDLVTRPDV
jgi:inosose dehydratase